MTEAGKQLQETATGHHFITRMRGDHDGAGTGGNEAVGVDDGNVVQLRSAVPYLRRQRVFAEE